MDIKKDQTPQRLGTDTFPARDLFREMSGRQEPVKMTCRRGSSYWNTPKSLYNADAHMVNTFIISIFLLR